MANARRRTKISSEETDIVPWDIVMGILSWLPFKALMRFRCVSKTWKKLPTDPFFVNLHKEHNYYKDKLLLVDNNKCYYSLDYRESAKLIPISPSRFATRLRKFEDSGIAASCDGLLCIKCLCTSRTLYLWNPCTGKYKKLPFLATPIGHNFDQSNGFYYNHNANDYLILSIIWGYLDCRSTVAIYSVCNNSWTTLPYIPYKIPPSGGILVNGSIHWISMAYSNGKRCSSTLIAFQIEGERFREVPLPGVGTNISLDRGSYVTEYRQKLCIILIDRDGNWNMWVMNEYGSSESWTKLHEINVRHFPFCLMKNGLHQMTVWNDDQRVVCDPGNEIRQGPRSGSRPLYMVQACSYSESLVNLKGFRK